MDKFPTLNLYRIIMTGIGGLILLAGFFIGAGNGFYTFVTVFGMAFFLAFSWLVVSEITKVLIRVEDHLDHIRYVQERAGGVPDTLAAVPSSDAATSDTNTTSNISA